MINKEIAVFIAFLLCFLRAEFIYAADSEWKYPGATIEDESAEERDAFLYMSALKRVSNQLRFERSEKLDSAKVTSTLYRLDRSEDMADVWRYYVDRLSQSGDVQFSCEHRACGTSTNWANRLYEIAKLTGRDDNQYYVIGQLANQDIWVSAYIVKNGRKQNYVYVQVIESLGSSDELSPQIVDSKKLSELDDSFWHDLAKEYPLSDSQTLVLQIHFPVFQGVQSALEASTELQSGVTSIVREAFGVSEDRLYVLLAGPIDEKQPEAQISLWIAPK